MRNWLDFRRDPILFPSESTDFVVTDNDDDGMNYPNLRESSE